MAGFFARNFPPAALAWVLVAVLAAALVLVFLGGVPLTGGASADYVTMAQALAGVDRSQPLRMKLEGQYAGPLQDTAIQRWRDPVDGTICYVYLPVAVPHEPGPNNLVQYAAANIGTISCMAPRGR
jgi:hypothetical protein